MKQNLKKAITLFLTLCMLLGIMLPVSVSAEDATVADTSWYDADATIYYLYDAADLLGLSALANEGNMFEDKTVRIMANIDLNPTWDATTEVAADGTVTVAGAATNVWTPIPLFKGTLDGNGHTISGIYSYTNFEVPASAIRYNGGLICELIGGCVKNLVIKNSLAFFESTTGTAGTARIRVGGFICRVVDSTLENLFLDIDTWLDFDYHYTMSGCICGFETANSATDYIGTVQNIVYAGDTGRIASDGKWNTASGSSRIYAAGMVGQNQLNETLTKLTMNNLAFIGTCYKPANTVNQFTGDALMAYTGGAAYNTGMATDNYAMYTGSAGLDYSKNTASATLDNVAKDEISGKNSSATIGSVASTTDTYGSAGWKTITGVANGAGAGTIVLPGSVVDMLDVSGNGTYEATDVKTNLYFQESNDGSSVRFVSVIDLTEEELVNFSSVGFTISMKYNGNTYNRDVDTTKVYNRILANGETINASDYGGTYFCVVEVTGLGAATGDIEFNISGTMTQGETVSVYGSGSVTVQHQN